MQVEVAEGGLDGAAELGGGGLVLGVSAGRVVQTAPQAAPHQTQAEGQLPTALLQHLQRHTGVLQSLPRLSHRWGRQVRGRHKLGRETGEERERESDRERQRETEKERERASCEPTTLSCRPK